MFEYVQVQIKLYNGDDMVIGREFFLSARNGEKASRISDENKSLLNFFLINQIGALNSDLYHLDKGHTLREQDGRLLPDSEDGEDDSNPTTD